jgi:hypothetical protein
MNQSRFLTQYDNKSCGEISNSTIYDYQLVGPSLSNTTWTDWLNITSCLPEDYYSQSRNLTQFDSYSCTNNQTFFESRNQTCDFCTPNMINSSVGDWYFTEECQSDNFRNRQNNFTEYDSNSCGEIDSTIHFNNEDTICDFCTPNMTYTDWAEWINTTCSETQMNQSRSRIYYDSQSCEEAGYLNSTEYDYQLVGPTLQNTTWTDWLNISCLSNNLMNQTRNLTQFDIFGCDSNQTFYEYQANESCAFDTTAPNINFTSPTENSSSMIFGDNIMVNVTASDAQFANITIYLYNSAKSLVNSENTTLTNLFSNFTGLSDGVYYFNATSCDVYNNCNSTETRNVTVIVSSVDISLPSNSANFGNLTRGQQSVNLTGIIIRNDGNVYADIEIYATDLWSGTHSWPGSNYLFRAGDAGKGNETNGAYNSTSMLTWTQMSSVTQTAIYSLNWSDERDTAALHLNVTVPSDESAGAKESVIHINAVQA